VSTEFPRERPLGTAKKLSGFGLHLDGEETLCGDMGLLSLLSNDCVERNSPGVPSLGTNKGSEVGFSDASVLDSVEGISGGETTDDGWFPRPSSAVLTAEVSIVIVGARGRRVEL
jgi:hypothetical protein